jgi:hypothetical protein
MKALFHIGTKGKKNTFPRVTLYVTRHNIPEESYLHLPSGFLTTIPRTFLAFPPNKMSTPP